ARDLHARGALAAPLTPAAHRRPQLRVVQFLLQPPDLLLQARHGLGRLRRRRLELLGQGYEMAAFLPQALERARPGERLDAADAGRDAAFRDDREGADLARRAAVGAAAQLEAEARDVDDAHAVAVLLAEE